MLSGVSDNGELYDKNVKRPAEWTVAWYLGGGLKASRLQVKLLTRQNAPTHQDEPNPFWLKKKKKTLLVVLQGDHNMDLEREDRRHVYAMHMVYLSEEKDAPQ